MKSVLDILATLPHRYPILLVDRIIEIDSGKSIHAIKNVTVNEPFFQGHFPGLPIMPGVLIIEALAQAGAVMALEEATEDMSDKVLLFRGIDKAKFRKAVVPGDQLNLHVKTLKSRNNFWTFEARAMVDGKVAAEAELSAIITDSDKA